MCGGDDHLAWKRPISSKACRGLRSCGGIGFSFLVWIYHLGSKSDMDQRVVTVDQFTTAMASIQEASASLRQEIDSQ
ncbi:hypothetical protein AAG906_038496 [Vitis piasezkii]